MPHATDSGLTNQSPPYVDVDLFGIDRPLRDAVAANGAGTEPIPAALSAFGRHWGSAEMLEQARLANEYPPRLNGDIVEFHPAYHRFMAESMKAGLHCTTWKADGGRAPAPSEVTRAAHYYMVAQSLLHDDGLRHLSPATHHAPNSFHV